MAPSSIGDANIAELSAAIRGIVGGSACPAYVPADPFWRAAEQHGVDLLAGSAVRAAGVDRVWPANARAALERRLLDAAALDALHAAVLGPTLAALDRARVRTLLLKGTGLAHTLYAEPWLRRRRDADLFVDRLDVDAAEAVLTRVGFVRDVEPDVEVASRQRHYVRTAAGVPVFVDLHWNVANPQPFAGVLRFDEAWATSIAVPPLGEAARTLGAPEALLLACIHPVAHHHDTVHLVWLWDIHLLVQALSPSGVDRFVLLVSDRGMRAVCGRALAQARDHCGTPLDTALQALADVDAAGTSEPSAQFLGGVRLVDVLRADLAALPGWRPRVRLLREHLFPPARYMRQAYASWPAALLPAAYVYRIMRGAPKWFRRDW